MKPLKPQKVKLSENQPLYIFGKHPVLEKLANHAKTVEKVFIKETLDKAVVEEVKKYTSRFRIPITFVLERKLDEYANGGVHQGLVALVAPIHYLELKGWFESIKAVKNPCVVLLDELEDSHNVGAIIRTAVAAGVHGVIIPKHRQAPIGGAAYKSAAGLLEKIPLIQVTNVNDAIRMLKENRFWIIGLHQDGADTIWSQDMDMPVCFVVGSEGFGMREKTTEICDFHVRIPMENGAESLNASVSAALMMYEWKRRQQ